MSKFEGSSATVKLFEQSPAMYALLKEHRELFQCAALVAETTADAQRLTRRMEKIDAILNAIE